MSGIVAVSAEKLTACHTICHYHQLLRDSILNTIVVDSCKDQSQVDQRNNLFEGPPM